MTETPDGSMNRPRHRDLVLSLKYSTVEACFSVPMLNLTLPSFPFIVAFAVQAMRWDTAALGLMTALPHLCNAVQPLLMALLAARLSTFRILALSFTLGALPWGVAGVLPWLGGFPDAAFAAILLVATLANSIASVAWSSAISEIVPPHISGRYFGRRNLIFGIWTLVVVFIVGHSVSWAGNTLTAFAFVFALAGLSRLIGLLFLTRMRFPPTVTECQPRTLTLSTITKVFHDGNYLRLVLFIGVWGLLVNASMPFYTVFLVRRLELDLGDVVRLTTLASLGGLVTLKSWGRLCDQYGNRPVLHIAALVWAVTALAMWMFAGPRWQWQLNAGYFIIGAVTAGFQLCQFNLMLKLSPPAERSSYVALFLALTSALTALGPMLGGQLLSWLPANVGELFGQPITRFHLLFALAAVGCLAATGLAGRVREPAEQPLENVWRAMQSMRSFNPMFSVLSVGELLLTPRGLVALGRRSLLSAKRQVRALGDVGEEIVEGSRDVVRRKLSNRK